MRDPLAYYANNTARSRDLIEACVAGGVKQFIFSSTAAVYGASGEPMLDEDAEKSPASPYGRSKLATEWSSAGHRRRLDALRRAALLQRRVDPLGRTGQSTPQATHLIKRACQAALGQLPYLGIFGIDFATPDGTGVRDYIHVSDLVAAHALALDHLRGGGEFAHPELRLWPRLFRPRSHRGCRAGRLPQTGNPGAAAPSGRPACCGRRPRAAEAPARLEPQTREPG